MTSVKVGDLENSSPVIFNWLELMQISTAFMRSLPRRQNFTLLYSGLHQSPEILPGPCGKAANLLLGIQSFVL